MNTNSQIELGEFNRAKGALGGDKDLASISAKNVTVQFGDFLAVDNVSFDAPSGSFITLLGPSGCGKTTLLKAIAGFIDPIAGQFEIGGADVTDQRPEARDTAMCFQSYALFPHLTVAENIGFGPRQKKLPRSEQVSRVDDAIEQVELGQHREKLPNALSGGQQQRVALARALALGAGVILFDEPLSNLDAKLRDSVRDEIRKLQRARGFTAIYVTHDQSEALAMSDTIIVMNKGAIVQSGAPEEIYNRPKTAFVADFIGTANIMSAEVIGADAASCVLRTDLGNLHAEMSDCSIGDKLTVSWRPESMAASGQGDRGTPVRLKVIDRVFIGNLTSLVVAPVENLDKHFRVEVLGDFPVSDGDDFDGYLPASKIVRLED